MVNEDLIRQLTTINEEKLNLLQRPAEFLKDRISVEGKNISLAGNNSLLITTRACGLPGFCRVHDDYHDCINSTMINCERCGAARASIFLIGTILAGLFILFVNLLVVLVTIHRYRLKKKIEKIHICRTSLAIADFFIGTCTVLYIQSFSFKLIFECLAKEFQIMLRDAFPYLFRICNFGKTFNTTI